MTTKLISIAAIDENRTIAIEGEGIPWDYPQDLEQYLEKTSDEHLLFGRKTFESTRQPVTKQSILLTRDPNYTVDNSNISIANSKEEALELLDSIEGDVYNIGGAKIYNMFLEETDELILSELPEDHTGYDQDRYKKFPNIEWDNWEEINQEEYENFTVKIYSRK